MLSILSRYYDNVYLFKPKTSRQANSEKYVICTGFDRNRLTREDLDVMISIYKDDIWNTAQVVRALGGLQIPEGFIKLLKLFNTQFVTIESDNIREGIWRAETLIEVAEKKDISSLREITSTRQTLMQEQSREFLKTMDLPVVEKSKSLSFGTGSD